MTTFYLVITEKGDMNDIFRPEEDLPEKIGYYSYVWKVTDGDNLKAVLGRLENPVSVNIARTKKAALEWVARNNAGYKANGNYLFGSGPFETGVDP